MQGDKKLEWILNKLETKQQAMRKKIRTIEGTISAAEMHLKDLTLGLNELDAMIPALRAGEVEIKQKANEFCDRKQRQCDQKIEDVKKRFHRETKQMQRDLAQYKSRELLELSTEDHKNQARHQYDLNRATTLAIYDSIISAIGNWSADGQVADDMEFLLQSILFPLVYEPVVSGDEDYFLAKVPFGAYEVVKRGREFVKAYREQKDVSITGDALLWGQAVEEVKEWLTRDALPLLYEIGSEDWQLVKPVDIKDMWKWKEQPMSRALEFPLIFDGMELVSMMGDEIRKTVDLATFQMATMKTRIEP